MKVTESQRRVLQTALRRKIACWADAPGKGYWEWDSFARPVDGRAVKALVRKGLLYYSRWESFLHFNLTELGYEVARKS